ncbi:Axin-like protein pry-1 [Caenorhabditis elegans]|uniref:Axin-like protein pry-1 n=1 Tax=Caenorhabditis elegans TaxID=6239 RepID=PRY1_CAEEL|nr:Axin-like protein pry-1 [Caenorhabditis elegans]O62090.2 RecName: Full=Axin-like protein pry-1; AltName: Full=Protein polyray [Caenorhabditis elegans]AAL77082.1 PRY-1 [Caenorhabditis elegans]CAB07332.2 Axin-like protein pry-1 [Caenorhabditis elegans]|eukprot:NP_493474.2 Axin-like protein pry-1 [Caenorhabditis elegans]
METHLGWARSLEAVLSDRSALDAFQEWLIEYSSPQYLDLFFAIRAYERMALEGKPEKSQLSKSIYSKFLSSRTGNCEAIPKHFRAPIGEKLRHGTELEDRVFSHCSNFVQEFLRRQHEEFVGSEEFIEAFNKMSSTTADQLPGGSAHHSSHQNTMRRSSGTTSRKSAAQIATQLTAEALLKSKHDRHSKLGETKLEKMYPPTRQPYVCNATTSHNDSAVSSTFSGDTPEAHRMHSNRLRHIRDEQARENHGTMTLPRVEKASVDGQQWDHSSESGRRNFAMEITRKLLRHIDKVKLNDEMEKRIDDIEECRYTTIDMVNGTEPNDDLGKIDEDEELDDYLKMKMTDDSQKGSTNRSPKGPAGEPNKSGEGSKNTTLSPTNRAPAQLHNTIRVPRRKDYPRDTSASLKSHRHHQIDTNRMMSQSMCAPSYSSASSSYSRDSFAPAPTTRVNFAPGSSKSSQFYDSSGIGSMAPSAFSATSSLDYKDRRQHRKAPTPKKHSKIGKNLSNLITISYLGTDKIPVVTHVPNDGPMTLAEFKRHFALPNGAHQLFFKTECEDGSAPFQLLLIKDEHHLLPVFEGRIAAELR